jgi:hypothetical protein
MQEHVQARITRLITTLSRRLLYTIPLLLRGTYPKYPNLFPRGPTKLRLGSRTITASADLKSDVPRSPNSKWAKH